MGMADKNLRSWSGVIAAAILLLATSAVVSWYALMASPVGSEVVGPDGWSAETRRQLKEHREAARTYIETGQIDKARVILKKLLEEYPQDADARVLMAKVLITGEKTKEAYEQIRTSAWFGFRSRLRRICS
jgi:Tfp pilus assembly protein PilF